MLYLDSSKRFWIFPEGTGFPVILDMHTLEPVSSLTWSPDLLSQAEQIRIGNIAEDPLTGDLLIGSTTGLLLCKSGSGVIRKAAGKQAAATVATTILFNRQTSFGEGRSFLVGDKNGGLLQFEAATEEVRKASLPSIRQDISNWSATNSTIDSQGKTAPASPPSTKTDSISGWPPTAPGFSANRSKEPAPRRTLPARIPR